MDLTIGNSGASYSGYAFTKAYRFEVDKVVEEYKELIKHIAHLKGILESKSQRMEIIKNEMIEIRDQYGDERRTEIVPVDMDFSMEDMIAEEEVVLTITTKGILKEQLLTHTELNDEVEEACRAQ